MLNEIKQSNWVKEFVEKGADLEHQRWARWQKYMFSKCSQLKNGDLVIPVGLVSRWGTQIEIPYSELSEAEKESDRKETRNYLPLISQILKAQREEIIEIVDKMEDPYEHGAYEGTGYDECKRDLITNLKQ